MKEFFQKLTKPFSPKMLKVTFPIQTLHYEPYFFFYPRFYQGLPSWFPASTMGSLFLQFESRKNFTTQPWPLRVEAVLRLPHYCYWCCCLAHYIIDIIRNEDNVRRKLKRSLSFCPRKRAPLEELTDSVERPREILRFVWVIRQGTGSANSKTE